MKKIEKVLACVDFSDFSSEVVAAAQAVMDGQDPEILLFNVIHARDIDAVHSALPYFSPDFTLESYVEKRREERLRRLEEMMKKYPAPGVRMQGRVAMGIPYEKILQGAVEEKVDLVVMGNKGRGNLASTLFGSNAEKVFRHCPTPLLSVRNPQRFGRQRASASSGAGEVAFRRIVAAIDFSEYSPQVLSCAAAIAERSGASLTAVNVINIRFIESVRKAFDRQQPGAFSAARLIDGETAKRLRQLAELIDSHGGKAVAADRDVRVGVPFEELLRAVESDKADLLVINAKGRTNLNEYLFGTTAEKAFRHCPVSVLTLNLRK